MSQPKNTASTTDPRLDSVMKCADELKEDARRNAKHIEYQSFGSDKNKKKKNSKDCDRGTGTGGARFCSAHLRTIYTSNIIDDDNKTEWCVEGRHNEECCKDNPCRLCNININNYIQLPMINFAKALCDELKCHPDNNDSKRYKRTLQSFLASHIISAYPGTNKENTILRIKVNDEIWIEYFIKLSAFSSMLKTSAPSGYKYKDRISIGRKIKIQSNSNRDLIFLIEKDPSYNDPEKEESRPVVNGVGWWNLLKPAQQNEIRNIIQLNQDQCVHDSFGFLIKRHSNVNSIEVELECTRHSMGLNKTPITLWRWPASNIDDNNSMSSIEHKSNGSGSPTISSTQSLKSASPMNFGYTPPNTLNIIPTLPAIPTIPAIPTFPINTSIQPQNTHQNEFNDTQLQPRYDYTNDYQQQQSFNDYSDNYNQNSNSYNGQHNIDYNRITNRYNPYYRHTSMRQPGELPPLQPPQIQFQALTETQNETITDFNGIEAMEQDNYNQNVPELPPQIEQELIPNNINVFDNFALYEDQSSTTVPTFYGMNNSFYEIDTSLLNNRGSFDNESVITFT